MSVWDTNVDDIFPYYRPELNGFDIELVGFRCADEWDGWDDDRPLCPWSKPCGAKSYAECPLAKQQAMIAACPKRPQ